MTEQDDAAESDAAAGAREGGVAAAIADTDGAADERVSAPRTRRERRHLERPPRPSARLTVTGVLGELLITAGVVVMLFLGWYLWLNDAVVGNEQQVAAEEVQQELQERWERGEGVAARPVDPGEPIVSAEPSREGEVFGALIVPRFGPEWKRSIASGVDVETVLNSFTVGVGHYVDTQMPGEVGNFAIAGHRRTYGSAFGDIDKLRLGDKIYVETVDGWYQYTFRGLEYVWPTGVEVLEPVPAAPGVAPTDRVLTMTSCNPRWSTAERIIAYAVYETWYPRADGPPAEISSLVEAGR